MINAELARAFNRIADLMEISGQDRFRINSYRRVARFLKSHPQDITVPAADNTLTDLPGIGKGTAG
ncbi:MAG: helix-hairpin-helix domain-containing protein, partial [Phycisphaerae bacterium]